MLYLIICSFNMSKKSLFSASLLLAISSLISRGLGVYRDHLFATIFGTDGTGIYNLDTYYAAFRIPDLLYSILIMGTISVAFMPIFSEHLAKKDYEEGWKFTSNVLNLLLLVFFVIASFVFVFAKPLMTFFVYGFTNEQIVQTAQLVRIMLISPLFFAIAAIAIGVENSFQKFMAQGVAPVLYNLGIIFGALIWGEKFGVYGLVFGVVIGAFFYMIIQFPSLIKLGFKWFPIFSFKRADTKEMFTLVIPRIISLSGMQVNLFVDTFIASSLMVGSLTVLNLAQNLQSLPFGIISVSVAITSFSLFTKFAAEKNWEQFEIELTKSIRITLYLLLPAILGMYLLRTEIIQLVLEGGNFGKNATVMTVSTLSFFLVGLVAQGIIPILVRTFFALKNTKLPLLISLVAMLINILFSFYLSEKIGVQGLALANAIGMWVNLSLLYFFLNRKFKKILISCSIMGVIILLIKSFMPNFITGVLTEFLYILYMTILGFLVYLGMSFVFKLDEAKFLLRKLKVVKF